MSAAPRHPGPGIFGILNLTEDSFSDGGQYLEPEAGILRARELVAAGADVVDVGAESTNPQGRDVPIAEEIHRLGQVIPFLLGSGIKVSVDTRKPEVMSWAVDAGVQWLNDIEGFTSPESMAVAAASDVRLVCMFNRSRDGRAREDLQGDAGAVADECAEFFRERLAAFERAGVNSSRVVFDPGMGFFLGPDPAVSLAILRRCRDWVGGHEVLISVSRKSFLGKLCGGREPGERGAATLAAELYAARSGVQWIRTHEPRPLRDAMAVLTALDQA